MQGRKIDSIISHLRANTPLGKSIRINIDCLQLIAGTESPIFMSRDPLPYIQHNWLLQLRDFMIEINAKIDIQELWIPKRQCYRDQYLMTTFIQKNVGRSELNNWGLYYQVSLLSEICYSTGDSIQPYYVEYNPTSIRQQKSKINWPIQAKPDEASFKIWKHRIKACFIKPENKNLLPLGAWDIQTVEQMTPDSHTFRSEITPSIYHTTLEDTALTMQPMYVNTEPTSSKRIQTF
jgi:hypothetical protein